MKWRRDTGQPYIRRANGKEHAASFRDALRLAFFREAYGPHGFYVLVQRRCGREVMEVGKNRAAIVAGLVGALRKARRSEVNDTELLREVLAATYRARERQEIAVQKALEAHDDASRKERLASHLCPWCYYFVRGSRLAGQAFTEWTCAHCLKAFMHGNTAVPKLCDECGGKLGLCVWCCADMELKKRRTLKSKTQARSNERGGRKC